jgi:hypothetical protein
MSGKNISKDILDVVKNKTGKSVSEKDIQKLAGTVKPSTAQSEAQLRQLIKQVSAMVGVPVAETTIKEIVNSVQNSQVGSGSLEQLMKLITKK